MSARATHGETVGRVGGRQIVSPEYKAWQNMHQRCSNANFKGYKHYGARGIMVCETWNTFEQFLVDMGRRPGPGWSLDRWPDTNGHYEPNNCRWANSTMQARNQRNTKLTDARANAIKVLDGLGDDQPTIASKFNVTQPTVSRVLAGKAWACR
jgi:hypothetical protein